MTHGNFTKKPITIQAYKYEQPDEHTRPYPVWLLDALGAGIIRTVPSVDSLFMDTRSGTQEAKIGDWLIKGVDGEIYPCSEEVFQATYESAPDGNDVMDTASSTDPIIKHPVDPPQPEPTWQDRLHEERESLYLKLSRLENFLAGPVSEPPLEAIEFEALTEQKHHMAEYLRVLDERIARLDRPGDMN